MLACNDNRLNPRQHTTPHIPHHTGAQQRLSASRSGDRVCSAYGPGPRIDAPILGHLRRRGHVVPIRRIAHGFCQAPCSTQVPVHRVCGMERILHPRGRALGRLQVRSLPGPDQRHLLLSRPTKQTDRSAAPPQGVPSGLGGGGGGGGREAAALARAQTPPARFAQCAHSGLILPMVPARQRDAL